MSKRNEIFKDAGIYTFSSYIAQALDVVNGLLVRRLLGPANMGVWTFLQVIQSYAKHSSLGVTTATARDVPYFREKGDERKVEEVKNLVYTFTVFTSLLTALAVAVYALLKRHEFSREIFLGLLAVAVLILAQRIYNLFVVLLRAHKEFVFVGILNIISSFTGVVLTIVLTWRYSLYGFYAAMILNFLLNIGIIIRKTKYRFSFLFDWKALGPLITLGVTILAADILRSVLTSLDRLVIAKWLGFEALGIYSVGLMADNYLYALPNMFAVIIFPHFQEAFAKRDHPADLEKFLIKPTLSIAYFFPFIIGFVWCSSLWFVPVFLPQYISGLQALKILCLGAFFLAFTHSFSACLITLRRHVLLIPITGACIVFGFAVNWLFFKQGWGIEGVAAAEGLISVVFFILLSWFSMRETSSGKIIGKMYVKIFLIFIYFALTLWGADSFVSARISGLMLRALASFVLFAVMMIPLGFGGERETGVVSTLVLLVREKISRAAKS